MKSDQNPNDRADLSDELAPEYDFDYAQEPNRFADATSVDVHIIALDPDVAAVFPTTESVNSALRGLIAAMPKPATN